MRLINVQTMKLESFTNDVPPYAILSHTWGKQEVTFQDMESLAPVLDALEGWEKIKSCAQQAVRDGWGYVWVDTCCIDKTNSAELGEAINSMFRWYEEATVCFVYLADVQAVVADPATSNHVPFERSRWFKRGWTLQELLAPRFLAFFDADWAELGTRDGLLDDISRATGIAPRYLAGDFEQASVAAIFSWAARRQTERVEDRAYSLMGLFHIHMPLIYGEGQAAFRRLQLQICQERDDESIFAWHFFVLKNSRLLADTPDDFLLCGRFEPFTFDDSRAGFSLSSKGLTLRAGLHMWGDRQVLQLNCREKGEAVIDSHPEKNRYLLNLAKTSDKQDRYEVFDSSIARPWSPSAGVPHFREVPFNGYVVDSERGCLVLNGNNYYPYPQREIHVAMRAEHRGPGADMPAVRRHLAIELDEAGPVSVAGALGARREEERDSGRREDGREAFFYRIFHIPALPSRLFAIQNIPPGGTRIVYLGEEQLLIVAIAVNLPNVKCNYNYVVGLSMLSGNAPRCGIWHVYDEDHGAVHLGKPIWSKYISACLQPLEQKELLPIVAVHPSNEHSVSIQQRPVPLPSFRDGAVDPDTDEISELHNYKLSLKIQVQQLTR